MKWGEAANDWGMFDCLEWEGEEVVTTGAWAHFGKSHLPHTVEEGAGVGTEDLHGGPTLCVPLRVSHLKDNVFLRSNQAAELLNSVS